LSRDSDLLDNIQQTADILFNQSPEAIAPLIKRWLGEATDYSEV
jgi:ATP-dependent DNA helicase RecG